MSLVGTESLDIGHFLSVELYKKSFQIKFYAILLTSMLQERERERERERESQQVCPRVGNIEVNSVFYVYTLLIDMIALNGNTYNYFQMEYQRQYLCRKFLCVFQ